MFKSVSDLPVEYVKGYTAEQKRAFLEAYNDAAAENKPQAKCLKLAYEAALRAGRGGIQ